VRMIRPLLLVLALVALPLLFALLSYSAFAHAASYEIRRSGLSPDDHNAIKHAYASAEIYSAMRPLLGHETSAGATLWLGEANERIERYVKHQPDFSQESYKDMRNNLTGVVAADWLYQRAGWTWPGTRLKLVGLLARDGILVPESTDPRLADIPNIFSAELAIRLMRNDTARLTGRFRTAISEREAGWADDLGLAATSGK
jgi:hypothetical protein